MTPTSPNHALQRTAPCVTLAAADHPAAFPQPARRAPQSLRLWSFGDAARVLMKHALLILILALTASAADPLPAKTPSEAAKTYYETLNKGVQADIEKLMSSVALAQERALPPDIQKMRQEGGKIATKYYTLTKVEVLKENIQGKRAWVEVRLHYKDGTSQQFNCGFMIEDGAWKTTND